MLEFKFISHLASMYLFVFGCLCFKIEKNSVKTELKVKEFLEKRNKSSFFKAPWKLLSTRGYICSHSHRFLAFLCSVILKHDPYNEVINWANYSSTTCTKHYISSKKGIIGQKQADQIRLYVCPGNHLHYSATRYYFSRTHIKSSLFVYVSNDSGFHIYPDAFVSDIDMSAIKKQYQKSKTLKKERETTISQYQPSPPPKPADLSSLFNQRMLLIFSKSDLQNAELFEYLNLQNQKWTYKKFRIHYNKMDVCSLRLQQQFYLCKQILDSFYLALQIDSTHYRKNDCRKRPILHQSWPMVNRVSTLKCPPTYSNLKHGVEKIYDKQSYFLSSGPDEESVIIWERLYHERYLRPVHLVSSIHKSVMQELLRIERSQPWTKSISPDSDTESQFSLSVTSSPDRQSTSPDRLSTSSIFSSSSQSTFSSSSSPDRRSSQSSFYGIPSPDRSLSPSQFSGTPAPQRTTLLSLFNSPSPAKKLAPKAVYINHDRYVAEEETVKFLAFKSIKKPYERFRLSFATNNVCSLKAKLRVQLCKEILESAEFRYQLDNTSTDRTSCQIQTIDINLHDREDLFTNKVSLLRCPSTEAFDSDYYLSSSGLERSAILYRLGGFKLIYPEAYISYVDIDLLEQKSSPKINPTSSPFSYFYAPKR